MTVQNDDNSRFKESQAQHQIIFVLGPTGSGKSAWAVTQAEQSGGIILNADSIQIYRYLDIGAAKPSREDRRRVRHELFDIVTPDQEFTAGDYRRAALEIIEKEIEYHDIYVVGGSGFYIQALERGMYAVPPISPEIKLQTQELEAQGRLWERLRELDLKTSLILSPKDTYRIKRAVEVSLAAGRPWSQVASEFQNQASLLSESYRVRKVGMNQSRELLRERISHRTKTMLQGGLIDEVRSLLDRGYGGTRALRSVGYLEVCEYFAGRLLHDQLEERIVTSTMQLAKKQMTWFRRDRQIEWR